MRLVRASLSRKSDGSALILGTLRFLIYSANTALRTCWTNGAHDDQNYHTGVTRRHTATKIVESNRTVNW